MSLDIRSESKNNAMKNHSLYCENCNHLTDETTCPQCGNTTVAPKDDDFCYFTDFAGMSVQMFSEILQNNNIQFLSVPVFGGYSLYNTPEYYRFYIRYDQYFTALDLYNIIWGENDQPDDPTSALGNIVNVIVDRPLGSVHPEHPDIQYQVNYGFVDGVLAGDGEAQDAYVLGVNHPVESFEGEVVAIVIRNDDVENKWVVAPVGSVFTKEEIERAVYFQEKFFNIEIVVKQSK